MMRIEELHVGSIINFYGRLATLQSVSAGGGCTVIEYGDKDFKICGFGHLTPTPISPEILTKIGFEDESMLGVTVFKKDDWRLMQPQGSLPAWSLTNLDWSASKPFNNTVVSYVHELQTLVLFHTGIVLTL